VSGDPATSWPALFDGRVFAAVLFDLDGTLIDSSGAVERSWRRWAQEYGLDLPSFDGWHGRPAAQVAAALLPADQVAAGTARIEEIEVSDVGDLSELPGAVQALTALPDQRRAIVTSCTMPLLLARLASTSLPRPGVLVTADQVARGKPDPEPFLLAAQRLGVDPGDCLVVEDAPAGLQAATAAGMTSLAVVTTHDAAHLQAGAAVPHLGHVRFASHPEGVRAHLRPEAGDSLPS
jgi:mannitol-1-/sugar-/sorbitol-6-phosphatase